MGRTAAKSYRPWEPWRYAQEAHCPATKLPEGDLVFFLLEAVSQLDLSRFYACYEDETRGAPPFDPAEMVCLLLYGYSVGVFSSRKIALACERNLAFLAIVGQDRPDFRTLSDFRKIHLDAFEEVFIAVLRLAGAAGMSKLGNIAMDGSTIQGNASRHKAMSYGYMKKEEERLRTEIDALPRQAQTQDAAEDAVLGSRRGEELPEELCRRAKRLVVIQAAQHRLEEQARAEADAERQRRAEADAERERTGQKRRGRQPGPIDETPDDKAQTNFTDPEMKIMKTSNKGWDYCANAQASVAEAHQIIVACTLTDASNDKQQAEPLAEATRANLEQAGLALPQDADGHDAKIPTTLDSGYYSEAAARKWEELGFDPYMATGRQRHHAAEEPVTPPSTTPATAKEQLAANLRTPEGRALSARRKVIVEPVFGQIKGVRGFRRFLLRGLAKVAGEWRLLCLTHNLLKIWRYRCAPTGN
ncbi:MAG: transposase [Bacteroidia bacterium]